MAEQPVGAQPDGVAPVEEASQQPIFPPPPPSPQPSYPPQYQYVWHPPVPRVVVKADLVSAARVFSTVALLGIAVGWLWSRLAPPIRQVITPEGTPANLTDESYHSFDALVIFMLLCLAAGLVTGVGTWYLRERRGPVVMLAAVLGGFLGGWLAALLGTSLAQSRWPVPSSVESLDIVAKAPELVSTWGILGWPLMAALAYGVLAVLKSTDDLGRRLG